MKSELFSGIGLGELPCHERSSSIQPTQQQAEERADQAPEEIKRRPIQRHPSEESLWAFPGGFGTAVVQRPDGGRKKETSGV
jgi:hypothetical protein